jgi:hypothetical protein
MEQVPGGQENQVPQAAKTNPEVVSTENGITTIRNGGKILRIPENLVDQYMIEHSQPELGGQYGPG